jgi:hypothetical protein
MNLVNKAALTSIHHLLGRGTHGEQSNFVEFHRQDGDRISRQPRGTALN